MKRLRAVLRRLDPWAALLLGVLVTLGVIILLATPGPWHRVVPAVATHPPLAPPPPPRDIAVFVDGPRREGCAGVVWLHIAYDLPHFTAVVVPIRLACTLPGAGLQPLSEIVDQAGPRVAASALGARLGVSLRSWVTIDPSALRSALPGFVSVTNAGVHPRPVPLVGVWTVHQPPTRALERQVRYLRLVLKDGSADELNLVGFANYILGSTDVSTSLRLQAVTAIGAALNNADAGDLVITSDIPLAAEVIAKGVRVLTPRGDPYDKGSIAAALTMRNFMDTLRSTGVETGGPAAFSSSDQHAFARQLDRELAGKKPTA